MIRTTLAALITIAALALTTSPATAAPAHHDHPDSPTHEALTQLTSDGTGAVATGTRDGDRWLDAVGTRRLGAGPARTSDEYVRIGSISKTFVSVSLLRLEAAGRLDLDDTVARWLPGMTRAYPSLGPVTLRSLLQQTSGIRDYLESPDFQARYTGSAFYSNRFRHYTPRDLVDVAMTLPAGTPGTWSYSNTNYVLAARVLERATHRSLDQALQHELLRPTGLRHTFEPGARTGLPHPHAFGYSHLFTKPPHQETFEVTRFDPSVAWGSGSMVSTVGDLERFMRELLGGKLLPAEQQAELLTAVPTDHDSEYGLGLFSYPLSCTTLWGHDGDIFGSTSYAVGSSGGTHTLAFNLNDNWAEAEPVLEAEFCGGTDQRAR